MSILIQIIAMIYFFAFFPVLLGLLENRIGKKEVDVDAEIYVNGYFGMFALFALLAIPLTKSGASLSTLAKCWILLSVVLSGVSLLFYKVKNLTYHQKKRSYRFWQAENKKLKQIVVLFLLISLVSILFVKPHEQDHTIAIVDIALVTDTMYTYHPYTGDFYGMALESETDAPLEMLYAAVANVVNASPIVLIQILLPIFLQMWFFLIYRQIGKQLWEEHEEKQAFFLLAVLFLHTTSLYTSEQAVGMGMFQNPWNGQTLLHCCVLPWMFLQCLRLQKIFLGDWKKSVWEILKIGERLVLVILSAQLVNNGGAFYIFLMLGITILVILARKGYYRYGIAFKDH